MRRRDLEGSSLTLKTIFPRFSFVSRRPPTVLAGIDDDGDTLSAPGRKRGEGKGRGLEDEIASCSRSSLAILGTTRAGESSVYHQRLPPHASLSPSQQSRVGGTSFRGVTEFSPFPSLARLAVPTATLPSTPQLIRDHRRISRVRRKERTATRVDDTFSRTLPLTLPVKHTLESIVVEFKSCVA